MGPPNSRASNALPATALAGMASVADPTASGVEGVREVGLADSGGAAEQAGVDLRLLARVAVGHRTVASRRRQSSWHRSGAGAVGHHHPAAAQEP